MKSNCLGILKKNSYSENIYKPYINKRHFVLYGLCGLVSSLPFLRPELCFLAFVCLIPEFVLLYKNSYTARQLYSFGFIRFFTFYFCVYSWLTELYPLDFLGIGKFESFCIVACGMIFIPLLHSVVFSFFYVIVGRIKFYKPLVIPCLWVIFEYIQSLGKLAFPWAKMSVTISGFTPFIQSAEILGNYFISFLLVIINSLLAYSYIKKSKKGVAAAFIALLIFSGNTVYGIFRIIDVESEYGEKINCAIIQGNANSNEKWAENSVKLLTEKYAGLMNEACMGNYSNIDLFVLPETAIPVGLSPENKNTGSVQEFYTDFCRRNRVNMIVGAFMDSEEGSENCAFFIDRNGDLHKNPYSKQHLVPFGEYLPYRNILETIAPFLTEMNAMSEDLKKGNHSIPAKADFGKIGSLICFDSVFDSLARKSVAKGANILCIITNDSWYGKSVALNQHNSQAIYRAVENRRHVLRAANTGISSSISCAGRVTDKIEAQQSGYIISQAKLSDKITFYTRVGNIIIPVCAGFVIISLFMSARRKNNFSQK